MDGRSSVGFAAGEVEQGTVASSTTTTTKPAAGTDPPSISSSNTSPRLAPPTSTSTTSNSSPSATSSTPAAPTKKAIQTSSSSSNVIGGKTRKSRTSSATSTSISPPSTSSTAVPTTTTTSKTIQTKSSSNLTGGSNRKTRTSATSSSSGSTVVDLPSPLHSNSSNSNSNNKINITTMTNSPRRISSSNNNQSNLHPSSTTTTGPSTPRPATPSAAATATPLRRQASNTSRGSSSHNTNTNNNTPYTVTSTSNNTIKPSWNRGSSAGSTTSSSTPPMTAAGTTGGERRRRWLMGRFGGGARASQKQPQVAPPNYGAVVGNGDQPHDNTSTLPNDTASSEQSPEPKPPEHEAVVRSNNKDNIITASLRGFRRHHQQRHRDKNSNNNNTAGERSHQRTAKRRSNNNAHNASNQRTGSESLVLSQFEGLLRIGLLLILAFYLGTWFPMQQTLAQHCLAYGSVAYLTCLVLLWAVQCEKWRVVVDHHQDDENNDDNDDEAESRPLLTPLGYKRTTAAVEAMEEGTPLLSQPFDDDDEEEDDDDDDDDDSHFNSKNDDYDDKENNIKPAATSMATKRQSLSAALNSSGHHKRSLSDTPVLRYESDLVDHSPIQEHAARPLTPSFASFVPSSSRTITTSDSGVTAKTSNRKTNNSVSANKTTVAAGTATATDSSGATKTHLAHPALKPLHIIDTMAGPVPRRVNLNDAHHLHVMDTEYFNGHLMIFIRTTDVDDPSSFSPADNAAAAAYLRGKQRRFEFQFQGKLKRVPTGRIFFACELDQPFKLGMIQRAFVGAAMAFVKSSNPFFHYSITGDASTGEPPHMAFPFVEGMNAIIATPPGQQPPSLGKVIVESAESQKSRKKGGGVVWNLEDTYTFALWSAYVDFLQWKCLNLPGIRPFALSSVLGLQHINMTVYEMDDDNNKKKTSLTTATTKSTKALDTSNKKSDGGSSNSGPHIRQKDLTWVHLELCNADITQLGPGAQQVVVANQKANANKSKSMRNVVTASSSSLLEQLDRSESSTNLSNSVGQAMAVESSTSNNQDPGVVAAIFTDQQTTGAAEPLDGAESADETEEEDEAAAELGEGIYIRSGDPIILKEAVVAGVAPVPVAEVGESPSISVPTSVATSPAAASSSPSSSVVTIGGGFCLLKEQQTQQQQQCSTSRIVIETAKRTRRKRNGGTVSSSLIKNGDTVYFKLLKSDGTALYLTIHRGWWLKWVSVAPNKNCYFTIHTTQGVGEGKMDYDDDYEYNNQLQPSYLIVGGTLWLQHKRWPKYAVGVSSDGSATYGGRLLALYRHGTDRRPPGVVQQPQPPSEPRTVDTLAPLAIPPLDDSAEGFSDEEDAGPDSVKGPTQWMNPVLFRAFDGGTMIGSARFEDQQRVLRSRSLSNVSDDAKTKLRFSCDDARMDAPAWIELLNRAARVVHLAYVVRVVPPPSSSSSLSLKAEEETSAFVRIRTGRDLADVMRIGQNWRNKNGFMVTSPTNSRRRQKSDREDSSFPSSSLRNSSNSFQERLSTLEPMSKKSTVTSVEEEDELQGVEVPFDDSDEALDFADDAEIFENDDDEMVGSSQFDSLQSQDRRRRGKLIGKFARSVKHRTSAVVKAGKGTVSAGKSMIPIRPKIPPMKEPNPKQLSSSRSRRRTERELHMALSRGMKRLDRKESPSMNMSYNMESRQPMAGELSAPEQSCRTVSKMLVKMSGVSRSSEFYNSFNQVLNSQINFISDHDDSFLHGKALDLGVTLSKKNGEAIAGRIVARCLWEGHWREEWCAMYDRTIIFYAPLTDTPSLELSLADIQTFRMLDVGNASPLPGLPILVLETAWQCHYIAFCNEETRRRFHDQLGAAKVAFDKSGTGLKGEQELWKARFWQGFQSSFEASLSGGKGKWAEIVSGKRKKRRVVLNNRRMAFDLAPFNEQPAIFCETLLSWCLSFRLESLLEHPEALGRFLDATSQLQNLPIHDFDYMGPETFCIFVNLYHCLLQHALLLTVNGPLTKRSCGHFMRTNCYEIGGDVFSLAELYLCVIRGRMSRPVAPKAPFFDVPKKSQAFRYYAVGFTSPLVNFVLNTGNVMSPRQVPILRLDNFYEQLSATSTAYLRKNLTADEIKRLIHIPRVCDVFRGDFCESTISSNNASGWIHECLRYCLLLLEEDNNSGHMLVAKIESMLLQEHPVSVKFQPVSEQYHSTLQALSLPKTSSKKDNKENATNTSSTTTMANGSATVAQQASSGIPTE
ncbi:hypothetical protein ACA910_009630 [Epithemia clementina (nom. ined.)]